MFHDVVTLSYMNMNAVLKDVCRPLGPKAIRAESNGRTFGRSGVKLVWHRVLSYRYARIRVQIRASISKVI